MKSEYLFRFVILCVSVSFLWISTGCENPQTSQYKIKPLQPKAVPTAFSASVVLAINVGGAEYLGQDGIRYQADEFQIGNNQGQSKGIKGTQDPRLFETYRQGNMNLPIALKQGIYDITLKFAEPSDLRAADRLFNVIIEGQKQIENLDITVARDGKKLSALVRTLTNIEVQDGELNIQLTGVNNEPVLHAIIVRSKQGDKQNWQLTWSDEFDYSGAPDEQKWNYDIWPARKVNDEDQTYTKRPENVRVEDGVLIIEAHQEKFANAEYTSGRIHSKGKGDFLYGKAEIRARIPAGQGTWPAIWMLPSDAFKYATTCRSDSEWQGNHECDAWPNSGEIDIMEYVGYDPHNIHGTVHNKAYYWVNWEQRKASVDVGSEVNEQFQVYSMEWGPEHILIAYNGTPYFYYANQGEGWQAWPFDHPYHIILNLAIGGGWGRAGGPIDDSIFPVKMEVDYVRIYQLKH
ncbi:family 16 glycosylhydrolase [Aliiglaciecola sp. 3_MG-2023]|uniref:malectin domain-containing carbohydrate-binding protein n=1 Tax=Aliiglaciecola sp. 3_MG-2023 TaxID=3062644 RepID=UPI0026E3C222|nr:malectin domain-containing carbohydrate-binding protein [Aliiglaciecola sp. 3_MG-2023]MDO6694137.1 family 16 glycosylhydrolase [Aliiglaciecola sp. 3_MG-2023]